MEENKLNNKIAYETCVRCQTLTDIPQITPVDYRMNYISGVGQLCPKCAETFIGDDDKIGGYSF